MIDQYYLIFLLYRLILTSFCTCVLYYYSRSTIILIMFLLLIFTLNSLKVRWILSDDKISQKHNKWYKNISSTHTTKTYKRSPKKYVERKLQINQNKKKKKKKKKKQNKETLGHQIFFPILVWSDLSMQRLRIELNYKKNRPIWYKFIPRAMSLHTNFT